MLVEPWNPIVWFQNHAIYALMLLSQLAATADTMSSYKRLPGAASIWTSARDAHPAFKVAQYYPKHARPLVAS